MKYIIILAALSGCAQFENRVACTIDREQAFMISKYLRYGVGSQIAKADADIICKVAK